MSRFLWFTVYNVSTRLYVRTVDISANRVEILHKIFTQLLSNKIYTSSPSFVETYLKMTKLCCFNRNNPHSQRSERSRQTDGRSDGHTNSFLIARQRPHFMQRDKN